MQIIISYASKEPIYEQIARQIKNQILTGELSAGDMLPSIRSLARELQISVITTKRAYEELEKEGLIETVGGKGSFVSGENKELLREKRLKMLEEKLEKAVEDARLLGLSLAELQEMLELIYREGEK
ncbi:MAG TPA: GntR family transcriptional regulator [Thermoanaerobacterales bacterium]|nr:GntR family transcriptional regulator [Thermoanaerobacterales bacterium]